ncbi:hypothetical protein ACIQI7_32290 [Kitasatospora sp. NPDC092039]|uniref:hypothetical protein n=1 Tax=Kitasatospora sp. NPDC092039 TaxID=3364086 RepID=UPI0037FDBAC2
MRWTSAARTNLAANLDQAAAADEAAAASGRAVAADPTATPTARQQAATASGFLADQARYLRADAAAVRDGADPVELGYPTP